MTGNDLLTSYSSKLKVCEKMREKEYLRGESELKKKNFAQCKNAIRYFQCKTAISMVLIHLRNKANSVGALACWIDFSSDQSQIGS